MTITPLAIGMDEQTDLHALNDLDSSIDKVSFKKKQHVSRPRSFGGKLFMQMRYTHITG